MSETKLRFYLKGIIIAIAYKHTFLIMHRFASRKFSDGVCRTVCMFLIKGLRQFSGRIDPAKQHFCQCSSAFHSRIPVPYHRRCIVDPCPHFHRTSTHHNDDCLRVCQKQFFYENILLIWKLHVCPVISLTVMFMIQSAHEDYVIILFCQLHGFFSKCGSPV